MRNAQQAKSSCAVVHAVSSAPITTYVMHTNCGWRNLPSDFPPWQTVYSQLTQWQKPGAFSTPGLHRNNMQKRPSSMPRRSALRCAVATPLAAQPHIKGAAILSVGLVDRADRQLCKSEYNGAALPEICHR